LLEKGAAEAVRLDAATLAQLLGEASARPGLVAVADPVGRRLGIVRGDASIEWSEVGSP
jgi:hypothetical protein